MTRILVFCLMLVTGTAIAKEIPMSITSEDCPRLVDAIEKRDMLVFKITDLWSNLEHEKNPSQMIAYLEAIERVSHKAAEVASLIEKHCG